MEYAHFLLAALLAGRLAQAFVRMGCGSRLVDERIDPIVFPGVPSSHVHAINGGNGFNFSQPDGLIKRSTCTTCQIKEDLSAYWTPKLYFHNKTEGTYTAVPQSGDGGGRLGGQTVYYLQRGGPDNDNLTAFPDGFRMISGDTFQRNYTGTFAAQAISFNCLDYNHPNPETNALPDRECPDGLRVQVFFPSCWDGVHLDSKDHKSHMSFPASGSYNGGKCPDTHPVHMISIFFEVVYSTDHFPWSGDQQPFVFANGDATGYGFHGDFVNGWDVPTLQNVIDKCTNDSGRPEDCDQITLLSDEEMQTCKIPPQIHEDVQGPVQELPGCNEPTYGPEYAGPPTTPCARTGVIGEYETYGSDLTKSGYRYLGCAPDSVNARTLNGASMADGGMTLEKCVQFCQSKGFAVAGAEYASQCYCGDQLPADKPALVSGEGACNMPCGGNGSEICGGPNGLSVYQKCGDGQACENAVYQPVV